MNKYFEVVAKIEGETEVLFGSFVKTDCKHEIEAERDTWKDQGYKAIKIAVRMTEEKPDPEVYADDLIISTELDGQHKDFTSVEDFAEYMSACGLEWVNSDTCNTTSEAEHAIYNKIPYVVLPLDNRGYDLTINFKYGA